MLVLVVVQDREAECWPEIVAANRTPPPTAQSGRSDPPSPSLPANLSVWGTRHIAPTRWVGVPPRASVRRETPVEWQVGNAPC
ncbi:hypothetical protein C8Q73DRAFT_170672 [Cubamyces lactineus]|nr:hypothetical protein C8Q73DRAFT_170672 [Cubamyces lactineus]